MDVSIAKRFKVSISVHIGDPVDWQKYRHTGLFFEPVDEDDGKNDGKDDNDNKKDDENNDGTDKEPYTYYMHIRGGVGLFHFETRVNYNVLESASLVRLVPVGTLKQGLTPRELERCLQKVVIHNEDHEFNCQSWVGAALQRLHQEGYLVGDECDRAFNEAIAVTMEAKDDPLYR